MILNLDFSKDFQITFQQPASIIMEGIINLHHYIFFFKIIIFIFVFYIFIETFRMTTWYKKFLFLKIRKRFFFSFLIYKNFKENYFKRVYDFNKNLKIFFNINITHGSFLEIIWTLVPSLILLLIVIPSFSLLYELDSVVDPDITIKVIGHQWYWSYEYTDSFFNSFNNENNILTFDSYLKQTDDLSKGELRLLEVDTPLLLPVYMNIRINVTSDDVLHCFAVPSLGLKVDACPGRLNVLYCEILREGIFFGQCSEICGVYHGFMPIKIIALNWEDFYYVTFLDYIPFNLIEIEDFFDRFFDERSSFFVNFHNHNKWIIDNESKYYLLKYLINNDKLFNSINILDPFLIFNGKYYNFDIQKISNYLSDTFYSSNYNKIAIMKILKKGCDFNNNLNNDDIIDCHLISKILMKFLLISNK